jgi:outer membrane protein assembly factor BamD
LHLLQLPRVSPSFGPVRARARALLTLAALAIVGLAGCKSLQNKDQGPATPEKAYWAAHQSMVDSAYTTAVKRYEALESRFPFSPEARQGRIDIMYVYYKAKEKDQAVDAVDTFIRENPTHPRVDYAYYIKGLVYFERTPNAFESVFGVDMSERPPQDARKSFEAFGHLVQQYPQSEYAPEAHQRMVYLRNRLAEYEIHVAGYYMRRGAYVAAINRCKGVLEAYDGAPAMRDALMIMSDAYQKLGLNDLSAESQRVLAFNFPEHTATQAQKHKWYQVW